MRAGAAYGTFVLFSIGVCSVALSQEMTSGRPVRENQDQSIIRDMVSQVSRDSLMEAVKALDNFQTRYEFAAQQDSAGDYLIRTMSRRGATTSEWYSIGTVTIWDVEPVDVHKAWCATDRGLLRSSDGGGTWLEFPAVSFAASAIDFINTDCGWVVGSNGRVARTNSGSLDNPVWTAQVSGTPVTLNDVDFLDAGFGIIAGNSRTIRRSTNGGSTWLATNLDTASVSLYGVSIFDTEHAWVVGSGGTILFSSNTGVTWVSQGSGTTQALYDVKFLNGNDGWAVGYGSTVLHTTNGGATWQSVTLPGDGALTPRTVDFADSAHGWIADYRSCIVFRTVDGGATWEQSVANRGGYIMCLRARSLDELFVCGTRGALGKSADGGVTWTSQSPNLPDACRHRTRNITLTIPGAVSPEEECVLLAHYDSYSRDNPSLTAPGANDNATGCSAVLEAVRIMNRHTYNKTVKLVLVPAEELGFLGSNTSVAHAVAEGRKIVLAVNVDMIGRPGAADSSRLYVYGYLRRNRFQDSAVEYNTRYNIGLSLSTPVDSGGLSDHVPFTIAGFNAINIGGGGDPNYHTAADTWEKVIPEIVRRGAQLALATVAEMAEPRGELSDRAPSSAVPMASLLLQNYPNPFNPKTSIGYTVGVDSRQSLVVRNVKLAVYDLLGREVAVLVNEKKEPGSYEVQFDGSGLSSGVYLCRMQEGDFVQTRRLLLVK